MKENVMVEKLRGDLPFLKRVIYMDSAAVSPAPVPTIEAMTEYMLSHPYNYGVGVFADSKKATSKVDEARRRVASFIGAASEEEVVFTKNTTEAINIVAKGLDWSSGDEVIITSVEHQSNIIP